MGIEELTTDKVVLWEWGFIHLNATIIYTWLVMGLLVFGSWHVTRNLSTGTHVPRLQNVLEVLVEGILDQIRDVSQQDPRRYLPFIGTLFIFIAVANVLSIVPGYHPPTGSLSTTAALALCVFFAVPMFGIAQQGFVEYVKHYAHPTPFMIPFHILGELSRTFALAVRLFGNVMSGTTVGAILLAIVPLFVPILMQALELLIGLIQAYIFAVLAMVYIAAASRAHGDQVGDARQSQDGEDSHGS